VVFAAAVGGRYEPYGAISVHTSESDQLLLEDAEELQVIAAELSRFAMATLTQEALTRESDLQAKLAEIGRAFSSSNQLEDVYQRFSELVEELIPYRRITLAEIDHSSGTIFTRFSTNSDGSDIDGWESGTAHDLAGTSAETMVKTKTGLYMNFETSENFAANLPGAPDVSAGLTGVLNVPLIVNGIVVGTLTLNTSEGQTFDDSSLELGDRIAAQISGSFLSASLSESLVLEAARRGSLNEIGEIISSSLDFPSVFPRFYETLKEAIDLDIVVITDIDVEAGTKIDFLQYGASDVAPILEPLEGSITDAVVVGNRVVSIASETLLEDEQLSAETRENTVRTLADTGMSCWLAAPLLDQGEVIGVLHVLREKESEFDTGDREFLSQVAVRVATAVVNSRLHESAQAFAQRQEILARLSREIGSSLESSDSFDRFATLLSELVPVDRVAIANVDVSNQTAESLYVSSSEMLSELERPSFRTLGTPTGHAADIGETVVINSAEEGARFSDWVGAGRGVFSSVTVPMGRDGEFARVFQISCAPAGSYGPDEVALIEQIANQISGAVANQQLYRRSIELGQERERSIRLEAETARLASVNEAKNDFLNLLTHELKTPLTSIIAFADLMGRGADNELSDRQMQQLSVIQRNAWQLDALIQDLVDVSSIERGNIELEPVETDVAVLVSGVLEGLGPNLEQRGQSVIYKSTESDEKVLAVLDRQRITQVVSNLVSNASKYSPKGTTVFVTVEAVGDQVMVIVEDEGSGIPENDLKNVFELFHRVDNEMTRQVPGTGQGLYLVKQLVELHGGSVRIGNRYMAGKGTRAVVRLPVLFAG
jgi:signal transduction histidine kinase